MGKPNTCVKIFSYKRMRILIPIVFLFLLASSIFLCVYFGKRKHQTGINHPKHWRSNNNIIKEDERLIIPTIVISLDGFRYDYLDRGVTPNLKLIYDESLESPGVRADYMTAQFPTSTFPNHYTMATGLYPEYNGIVGNTFYDPVLNDSFDIPKVDKKWFLGEPIWITAGKFNRSCACYYWTGCSEYYPKYNILPYKAIYADAVIDQIVKWKLVEDPDLIMAYIADLDRISHKFGINSKNFNDTLISVDNAIGVLIKSLKDNKLYSETNIIIVSDHGMVNIKGSIDVSPYVNTTEVYVPGISPVLSIYPNSVGGDKAVLETFHNLKTANLTNLSVYLRDEAPPHFHLNDNKNQQRIPPLIAVADDGYEILLNTPSSIGLGYHGYDNELMSMKCIFIARGPNIKSSVEVGRFNFQNTDLFNFIAKLMKIDDNLIPSTNSTNYLTNLIYTDINNN